MAKSFSSFLAESYGDDHGGISTILVEEGAPNLYTKRVRAEINADLAEATEASFQWPLAGLQQISDVLYDHGLVVLNKFNEDFDEVADVDEIVLGIVNEEGTMGENPLFLYVFYEPADNGKRTQFYAEIVNEQELHQLLDETLTEEQENDDDDDDDNDGESEDHSETTADRD